MIIPLEIIGRFFVFSEKGFTFAFMKRKVIFVVSILSVIFAMAQNPVFRQINNLNGLPSNTVYDILQDEMGFVWVAHDKGLSRYDGKTFVHFKSSTAQGKSLSNLMRYGKTIWCQDFAGNFYHTENDTLARETSVKAAGFYASSMINEQGKLISVNRDSIRILDVSNKKMIGFGLEKLENPIIFEKNNSVKIFNQGKEYDLNGKVSDEKLYSNDLKFIFFIEQIKDKIFGFSKDKNPYIYALSTPFLIKNTLKKGLFIQNVQHIGHEIWICTSTGAYCFDEDFNPKYDGFCFFEGTSISATLKDREGNYWFSTLNRGLYFVANLNFRLYAYHGASITALTFDDAKNELLLGTDKNEIVSFSTDNQFVKKFSSATTHEIISVAKAYNQLFVASNDFSVLNHQYKTLWKSPISVKDFIPINDQIAAVAFSNGVMIFAKNGQPFRLPKFLENIKGEWSADKKMYSLSVESSRGRSVAFNPTDSTLYAATSKGLFYFSKKGSGAVLLNNQTVFASKIKCIDNQVFASTFNQGFLKIEDLKASTFLTVKDGLFSKTIYHFQKNKSKIWLIEDGMLQSFDAQNKVFTNYSYADGLPKAEIKDIVIHNEKIFLATTEGLVLFDENQNTKNPIAPKVVITSLKVNGNTLPWRENLTFSPSQNNIDLLFSVLSFRGEGNLTIQYNINDGAWLPIQQDARVISLTALSSGNYKVKIQAFNEDGIAENRPLEFNFTIATPWYKQWFVIVITIIALMALIYFYFSRRIKMINKNNALVEEKLRLEQEVQKSMLASIKSQMNPHFLFNALNTIQSYIYTNDKENASIYLGKFSDLTRSILEMSNKETVSLSEEIKALQLYLDLEKLRFEDTLFYTMHIDENVDTDWVHIPSMLIQPYVENAIKHGLLHKKDNRNLAINFKIDNHSLHVSVEDNGIGRKRSAELNELKTKQHKSFAVTANQKRLDILNYGSKNNIVMRITDKQNDAGQATGTRVDLFIPIKK
jgi:ligand-binding sensor domain-containing protein